MDKASSHVLPGDAAQAQLAKLDRYEGELRSITAARQDNAYAPLDLLLAAKESLYRRALDGLLPTAAAALERGEQDQALLLLDTLARQAPDHFALRVHQKPDSKQRPPQNGTRKITRFLEQLISEESRLAKDDATDLRAALGLRCFHAGRLELAAILLDSVEWERIKKPTHFLDAFSLLYWGGLAVVANKMASGISRNTHWSITQDTSSWLSLGVACAHSGLNAKAEELLAPLLPQSINNPAKLFQIVDGLRMAGCTEPLRSFFSSPGVLAQLKKELDDPQLLRLSGYLLHLGLAKEASEGYTVLASKWNELPLQDVPAVAFGFIHTRNKAKTNLLISNHKKLLTKTSCEAQDLRRIALAETFLMSGRCNAARSVLNSISASRELGDLHSPRLFYLHERVSQPWKMRELMPSLIGTAKHVPPHLVHHVFALSFYEGKLEEGLAASSQNQEESGSSLQYIRSIINFHLALGQFSQAERLLDNPLFKGKGTIALPGLHIRLNLALAEGEYAHAVELFEDFLKQTHRTQLNISLQQMRPIRIFEFALLLRFIGATERALSLARDCVREHIAPNNPCRVLVASLSRELGRLQLDIKEAKLAERVADTLCMPAAPCQALLYLHAAMVHSRLNNVDEAQRILNSKMPQAIFLAPQVRTSLLGTPWRDIPELRDLMQSMFFPYFKDTYWNKMLDGFLQ
jgi:hypothetical protein